jgi:ectoine hydroxylase-related dioxygenase (phytanoyl-CoA dioxygenase family)
MQHAREFREQGFTVARGFFSEEEVGGILSEIRRRAEDPDTKDCLTVGGLVFTSNVFKGSEKVQKFIAQQRIIDFLKPIAGGDLWVRWDQAVTKHPGAGVFRWHQDNGYNHLVTEHYQVWIALTESKNQNGGLWLAPGSHKRGLLPHNKVTETHIEVDAPVGESVCIDANIGDLVVFSSLTLHRTGPNEADSARTAYVVEYVPWHDYDFAVSGPFLIASTAGRSDPHFVKRQPGALNPLNQLRYWKPHARALMTSVGAKLNSLKQAIRS